MEVVTLVLDSLCISGNRFVASLADLGVELIVAVEAVRMVIVSHIHVARQTFVTFKTAEMFHVPISVLRLCVLPAEDQLLE